MSLRKVNAMAALHPKDFFKKDVICIFWLELNDVRECGTPARSHVGWYNKAYRYFTDKGLPVTARDSPWQLVFECAKKMTSLARMSLNFWYVFGVFGTHPWQDVTARDSPSSRLTHRCWDSGFFNNSCSKMFQASFARVCFRLILFSPVVMAVMKQFYLQ